MLTGVIIGIFIGGFFGILIMALYNAAAEADRAKWRELDERHFGKDVK